MYSDGCNCNDYKGGKRQKTCCESLKSLFSHIFNLADVSKKRKIELPMDAWGKFMILRLSMSKFKVRAFNFMFKCPELRRMNQQTDTVSTLLSFHLEKHVLSETKQVVL